MGLNVIVAVGPQPLVLNQFEEMPTGRFSVPAGTSPSASSPDVAVLRAVRAWAPSALARTVGTGPFATPSSRPVTATARTPVVDGTIVPSAGSNLPSTTSAGRTVTGDPFARLSAATATAFCTMRLCSALVSIHVDGFFVGEAL